MTQVGAVLVVDDQAERASALVSALDDPHHCYEITPEAPDIERYWALIVLGTA
jgi:hypothetical protein